MNVVDFLVFVIGGFLLGEVLDVWYDGRVYYEHGEKEVRILETMPLHFGQIKYHIQFRLPESYEHYHWGIWLLTISIVGNAFAPQFLLGIVEASIGVALSLIMDENRTGIGGHPFGIGKEFTRLSLGLGVSLVLTISALLAGLLPRYNLFGLIIAVLLPFLAMPPIHILESRGILREPWPHSSLP